MKKRQIKPGPACASLRGALGAVLLACATSAVAGNFTANFNDGQQPPNASLYGNALVVPYGGVADSGMLILTEAFPFEQGSMVIDDLDGGTPISGFTANFKLLVGGGSQADGFSFNFGNDLPDDAFGEEGAGSGLTISFDTYDNGGGEAPAIDLKKGGVTIASLKGVDALNLFRTGAFVDVNIVAAEGNVSLTVNGTPVFTSIPGVFEPSSGRFGLGARTGGLNDNHFVDEIQITTSTAPPANPVLVYTSPRGTGVREDSIVQVVIRDGATTQLNPGSVKLSFNGVTVAPTVSKSGSDTTITYDPPGLLSSGADQNVTVTYSDNGATPVTNTATFTFQTRYYLGPNGNIFELIVEDGEHTWGEANILAQNRTYHGRPGHLATVTSYEEDLFVNKVRLTSFPFTFNWEVWLGGYQDLGLGPTAGWHWVNNEGPISGINGSPTYSNWGPGEPNDYFGPDSENYLSLGLNGRFMWNDTAGAHRISYNEGTLGGYIVEYEALNVGIDVKPGENPNVINVQERGKLTVAVLSQAGFDATKADVSSIRFGKSGIEASALSSSRMDVNGDGKTDLMLVFNFSDTDLGCGDYKGLLSGRDAEGLPFKGSDSVQMNGCPAYSLSLAALQDVNKKTDLQLMVKPLLVGYTAPSAASKVQLKSYTIAGRLGWTKNINNVPLAPAPDQSTMGSISFTDLLHFQPIRAQVSVPNSKSGKTEVLRGDARVLYRPDLAVDAPLAPPQVTTIQTFNVSASLHELKGDLGAKADAFLIDNGAIIDAIYGMRIEHGGSASLVFTARLTEVGTHNLKISIANVNPGDYNPANNEINFPIDVIVPTVFPVFFDSYYSHYVSNERDEWDDDYSSGSVTFNYKDEYFSQNLYLPVCLTFPIQGVSIIPIVDGVEKPRVELTNIPGYFYDYGCGGNGYAWPDLGDSTYLNINTYKGCDGYQTSYISFYKYASSQLYFSVVHDKFYGTDSTYSYSYGYGTPLNASTSVGTYTVVNDVSGAFGGKALIPSLDQYPWSYSWENVWDGGYYRQTVDSQSTYGYASGVTEP